MYKEEIEKTYTDLCTVTEFEKFTKGNKTTAFRENVKYSDIPCRLSLESKNAAAGTGTVTNISQSVKEHKHLLNLLLDNNRLYTISEVENLLKNIKGKR